MLLTNYTKTTITNQPVPRLPFIVIVILLAWRSGRGEGFRTDPETFEMHHWWFAQTEASSLGLLEMIPSTPTLISHSIVGLSSIVQVNTLT